jgi:hypothetical protein
LILSITDFSKFVKEFIVEIYWMKFLDVIDGKVAKKLSNGIANYGLLVETEAV